MERSNESLELGSGERLWKVEPRTVDFEECGDLTAEATKRHRKLQEFDGGGKLALTCRSSTKTANSR